MEDNSGGNQGNIHIHANSYSRSEVIFITMPIDMSPGEDPLGLTQQERLQITLLELIKSGDKSAESLLLKNDKLSRSHSHLLCDIFDWSKDKQLEAGIDSSHIVAPAVDIGIHQPTGKLILDLRSVFIKLRDDNLYHGDLWETDPFTYQPEHLVQRLKIYHKDLDDWITEVRDYLEKRNNPSVASPEISKGEKIPLQTTQEITALFTSQADGKHGRNYKNDLQALTRTHNVKGSPYSVTISLNDNQKMQGLGIDHLEQFTGKQDVDASFTTGYVLDLLLNSSQGDSAFTIWVGLDDIARMIGLGSRVRGAKQTDENRRRIHEYLKFVDSAVVAGTRSIKYYDGKELSTDIQGPLWRIMMVTPPENRTLFQDYDQNNTASLGKYPHEVPTAIKISLNSEWVDSLTHPKLKQFLSCGEILCSIPGERVAGDWARSIGSALGYYWRLAPSQVVKGTRNNPTRRELLYMYIPKTSPEDILNSDNPTRARDYWRAAITSLVEKKFIRKSGEGAKPDCKEYPRKGWQQAWLSEQVEIQPSDVIYDTLKVLAEHTYQDNTPKNLKKPLRKRRIKAD